MKTVTLGIATYGGADLLENCLLSIDKSVRKAKYTNFDVLVVDDGSPDPDQLAQLCTEYKARYLRCNEQKGNVARYNTIVQNSRGDFICLLDNDVVIPDRWFCSLLYFVMNNKFGVASWMSQKISRGEAAKLVSGKRIVADGSGRAPERATELAGYCYAFSRANWKLVQGFRARAVEGHGFDEDFKYFMGDSDFCCRLAEQRLMSYRMLYPFVYHVEHATYDAHPELDAWKRVDVDLAHFCLKWGCTPKEKEQYYLGKVQPQKITWYAHYAVHSALDAEDEMLAKKLFTVMEYDDVGKEANDESRT